MYNKDEKVCPDCGGTLKYYDSVKRIVRTKGRKTMWINVRRMRCKICGTLHRDLPAFLFPYRQYEVDIVQGVLEGLITSETLGYEDYPCEMTMRRWKTQKLQLLLWKD